MLTADVVGGRAGHYSQTRLSRLQLRDAGRRGPGRCRQKLGGVRSRRRRKLVGPDDVVVQDSLLSVDAAPPPTNEPVRRARIGGGGAENLDRLLRVVSRAVEERMAVDAATYRRHVAEVQADRRPDVAVDVAVSRLQSVTSMHGKIVHSSTYLNLLLANACKK